MLESQLDTQEPGAQERWDNYLASVAAAKEFEDSPSLESAVTLCQTAAESRDCEPESVLEALLTLEKGMRATAKSDDGELSRSTLASLDGAWRLVFTTGTAETQKKIGGKINYFPLRAVQTFNTTDMAITNGIYIGKFPVLRFFGSFDWLEDPRRLEFDFDTVAIGGAKLKIPKGRAEKLGAWTGLGSKNNVERAKQGKKAFFNWISADDKIATARGGGGGLALWKRTSELEEMQSSTPKWWTPTVLPDPYTYGDVTYVPDEDYLSKPLDTLVPQKVVTKREVMWYPIKNDGFWLTPLFRWADFADYKYAPPWLDGSLPGDYGFDPLCLVALANQGQSIGSVARTARGRKQQMKLLNPEEQRNSLLWMRESEVKHGRLAMMACLGWVAAEKQIWATNLAGDEFWEEFNGGKAPSLFNGGLNYWGLGLFLISIGLHAHELTTFNRVKAPGDWNFDPLGLQDKYFNQEGPAKRWEMQLAEIKHGRVAMLAITGFAVQEFFWPNGIIVRDFARFFFAWWDLPDDGGYQDD